MARWGGFTTEELCMSPEYDKKSNDYMQSPSGPTHASENVSFAVYIDHEGRKVTITLP
jgi:hypothetical protein